MRRIQLHLQDDLDDDLARQARVRNMSKAALLREYLAEHSTKTGQGDPSARLIGVYDGGADESSSADDVVYR